MPRRSRRQADKIARHRGRERAGVQRKALWAGLGILALILVPVAVAAVFAWNITRSFDNSTVTLPQSQVFPQEQSRPAERSDKAQTILLLGSDTRGSIDPSSVDSGQNSRTDTIMVARIPADRSGIYVTSIMRDSWVDIPGYGMNKINAAFAYGGVPLTVQTVEQLLDTRIDHVAIIDFDGFLGLTNALGGITVTNERAFSVDSYHFDQGEITLNGDQALVFVRERYSFEDGDYQRTRNQQAYMRGLLDKLISRETLTNPGRIAESSASIAPFLTVDGGLDSGYMIRLAPGMRDLRPGDVHFMTLSTEGPSWSPDGTQSIILLDETKMDQVRKAFRDDDMQALLSLG